MRKFGLIGFPLSHSFSKKYFEEKFGREKIFDSSYDLFEIESIEELPSLLESNPELIGLNVTIPYKKAVIPFLHEITDEAEEIGAVNCIKCNNGKMKGWNTDCYGFEQSLTNLFGNDINKNAIALKSPLEDLGVFVLGTGGSSRAVQFVLKKSNLPFIKVSRVKVNDCIQYQEIPQAIQKRNLFINTTPLGMFPDVNTSPKIPYDLLSENDFLFDLVYNPTETLFLKRGKERGAKTKNGLEMLQLQAEKSWKIWNR